MLFLSDILGASDKMLDTKYKNRQVPEERWSELNFPKENYRIRISSYGKWLFAKWFQLAVFLIDLAVSQQTDTKSGRSVMTKTILICCTTSIQV